MNAIKIEKTKNAKPKRLTQAKLQEIQEKCCKKYKIDISIATVEENEEHTYTIFWKIKTEGCTFSARSYIRQTDFSVKSALDLCWINLDADCYVNRKNYLGFFKMIQKLQEVQNG